MAAFLRSPSGRLSELAAGFFLASCGLSLLLAADRPPLGFFALSIMVAVVLGIAATVWGIADFPVHVTVLLIAVPFLLFLVFLGVQVALQTGTRGWAWLLLPVGTVLLVAGLLPRRETALAD